MGHPEQGDLQIYAIGATSPSSPAWAGLVLKARKPELYASVGLGVPAIIARLGTVTTKGIGVTEIIQAQTQDAALLSTVIAEAFCDLPPGRAHHANERGSR